MCLSALLLGLQVRLQEANELLLEMKHFLADAAGADAEAQFAAERQLLFALFCVLLQQHLALRCPRILQSTQKPVAQTSKASGGGLEDLLCRADCGDYSRIFQRIASQSSNYN